MVTRFEMQTSLAQRLYQERDQHVHTYNAEAHDIYLLHLGECVWLSGGGVLKVRARQGMHMYIEGRELALCWGEFSWNHGFWPLELTPTLLLDGIHSARYYCEPITRKYVTQI